MTNKPDKIDIKNKCFLKIHFFCSFEYLTSSTSFGQNPIILHIFNENNVTESPISASRNNDKSWDKNIKIQDNININAKKPIKYIDESITIMLYNIIYIIVIFKILFLKKFFDISNKCKYHIIRKYNITYKKSR